MRIRGRVIKNFNGSKAIKKYFHIQTVFMILMTCLLARVIYENDRIEYTLEDIQKILLDREYDGRKRQHGVIEEDIERRGFYNTEVIQHNTLHNSDAMEQSMHEMDAGETRYINGYRVKKVR